MNSEDVQEYEQRFIELRRQDGITMTWETEIIMRVAFAAGLQKGYSLGCKDTYVATLADIHSALGLRPPNTER